MKQNKQIFSLLFVINSDNNCFFVQLQFSIFHNYKLFATKKIKIEPPDVDDDDTHPHLFATKICSQWNWNILWLNWMILVDDEYVMVSVWMCVGCVYVCEC